MSKVQKMIDSIPIIERESVRAALIMMRTQEELHLEADLTDIFKVADEILHLRLIKAALKFASEAVNERLDDLNEVQYEHMVENETQSFNRRGQILYVKENVYVKSAVEYNDDHLVDVLTEHGLGDLAKARVNANSFGAAIREKMKTQDENGNDVFDEDLLPEDLRALCVVTRIGEVGIRKAGK